MAILVALAVGALGALILGWSWRRERVAARAGRAGLLDGCRLLFETVEITTGADGFPRLDGTIQGRRLVLEFIPDTMTIRRLPQLWLCATLLDPLPVKAGFAVLVRPSGAEFYSLTERFEARLEPPPGLPSEILARGASHRAAAPLAAAGPELAALLADPRVKEVAATRKGVRAIFRAAEGQRGAHLLLRQCVFEDADVRPLDLLWLHDGLVALASTLAGTVDTAARPGAGIAPERGSPA